MLASIQALHNRFQDGKLGQGDEQSHNAPVPVRFDGKNVKSVVCGYDFTAALTEEGYLFTCADFSACSFFPTTVQQYPNHLNPIKGEMARTVGLGTAMRRSARFPPKCSHLRGQCCGQSRAVLAIWLPYPVWRLAATVQIGPSL